MSCTLKLGLQLLVDRAWLVQAGENVSLCPETLGRFFEAPLDHYNRSLRR
jgi:hypothetical protein